MSDWWAKKLGQQQPQYPGGIVLQPVQQPVYVQQPQPVPQVYVQPQQQAPQQPVQPGRQALLDPNRDPNAQVSMGEAIKLWQGGVAHRREGHLACPECGSETGYTQYTGTVGSAITNANTGMTVRGRPHCFECGYNGSYTQGLESTWA